jgi:protein-disulfide isomerase
MPFVMDPGGTLAKEVRADYDLGIRLGVRYTPTVVVVTHDRYQVVCGGSQDGPNDPDRLLPVVEAALAQTHPHPAVRK